MDYIIPEHNCTNCRYYKKSDIRRMLWSITVEGTCMNENVNHNYDLSAMKPKIVHSETCAYWQPLKRG